VQGNDYYDVAITLRDSEGKAFSNFSVDSSVLFGRPAEGHLGAPAFGFGIDGERYPCGSLTDGMMSHFSGPGLFYPEIYMRRKELMYLDFERNDSAFTSGGPIDFPVLLEGVKVVP
jgi:hypothetical protein